MTSNTHNETKYDDPSQKITNILKAKTEDKKIVLRQGKNEIIIDASKLDDLTIEMQDVKKKVKIEEKAQKPVIRQVLKCYRETGLSKDLDVRSMVITPNGEYLIICSELEEGEIPRVCVWSIDKILQKVGKEEFILEGSIRAEERGEGVGEVKKTNWLLCVDALTTEINNKEIWIVCAGSINGEIYVWIGDVDEKQKEWNLKPKFYQKFSEESKTQKAIFDIKILPDKLADKLDGNLKEGFRIFFSANTIGIYSKDKTGENFIGELHLIPSSEQPIQRDSNLSTKGEWILTFDLYNGKDQKFLISGSNDNNIYKFDLDNDRKESVIGSHENGITCVKIFKDGTKVASGCLDNVVRVWDIEKRKKIFEKFDHTKEIVSLVVQDDDKYLFSASKDNTIKVWNITDKVLVRNINLDDEIDIYNEIKLQKKSKEKEHQMNHEELKLKDYGLGLDFLRQILLSPRDQYIFAIKKNKVLILRNYGRIWHFYQQLKLLELKHKDLYKKIYGPNLKQIVKTLDEDEESLKKIYTEIKTRLKDPIEGYNPRKLGALFVPSFIKFEGVDKDQRIYIDSVRTNYESYWFSTTKMFHEVPHLQWKFKLFLTTDIEKPIEYARFIEITNFNSFSNRKNEQEPFIILRDRTQSQLRFLMVLDRVPTTFIPLLKAVNLDIEDDRGDKDKLIFTDFKLSIKPKAEQSEKKKQKDKKENNEKENDQRYVPLYILKKPYKSIKDKHSEPYEKAYNNTKEGIPDKFYYSDCIFKLNERYSVEDYAKIKIRKISVELTESLNPLESRKEVKGDIELFEAFRNNFHSPPNPHAIIKIGKGSWSRGGKILDKYLAGLVMLDFLFTIISVLILYKDIFEEPGRFIEPIWIILLSLNAFVSVLFITVFILILIKKPIKTVLARRRLGTGGIKTN
ncbi:MAG: hypothetical protein ACFFEN_01140 [Candidatus Thorarchaeota archaeon]